MPAVKRNSTPTLRGGGSKGGSKPSTLRTGGSKGGSKPSTTVKTDPRPAAKKSTGRSGGGKGSTKTTGGWKAKTVVHEPAPRPTLRGGGTKGGGGHK